MITPITIKDDWDAVLGKIENFDCYHTYEYHVIAKKNDEVATLLHYQNNGVTIALPLLKRPIGDSGYYDFTSVYGYAGPIYSNNATSLDFKVFQKELKEYFLKEKIVSVFSRLNPYIEEQEKPLLNLGRIKALGDVVSLNLTKPIDEQRLAFSKTTKRYLNKARKFCDIKRSNSNKDVDAFIALYYENMDRVNAEKSYYFDRQYFLDLFNSKDFKTEFIYVTLKETGEIISGIITIRSEKTIHYHLSGAGSKYLHLNPLRLLLDEVRIMASHDNLISLNLGGGLGNKEDDLFYFKTSFSKNTKKFKIWKYIVNEDMYFSFTNKRNRDSDFFPAYRAKENQVFVLKS